MLVVLATGLGKAGGMVTVVEEDSGMVAVVEEEGVLISCGEHVGTPWFSRTEELLTDILPKEFEVGASIF